MEAHETIRCRGHPHVLSSHPATFEVTTEGHLTEKGNCIIGIAADKGCYGLSPAFRTVLANNDAVLVTRLYCGDASAEIRSKGSARMTLDHKTDMVWRRSTFICGRTIGILSDHVASTLHERLIGNLVAGREMVILLTATRPG